MDFVTDASKMGEMLHAINGFGALQELELYLFRGYSHEWTMHVTNVLGMW
jgi:hypothetical protein